MKVIHHDPEFKIVKNGVWLVVNDRKFGFTMRSDDGEAFIIVHARRIGSFAKEFGFYVPRPLLKLNIIFEVQVKKGVYAHYIYRRDSIQRLLRTPPEIFVSLARLEFVKDAEHYVRPPFPKGDTPNGA